MNNEHLKPVRWLGSSLEDTRAFPVQVKRDIGQALFAAQMGDADPAAKPLKGFGGASVMEIIAPLLAILGGRFIQCVFRMSFMYCMRFRRNRKPASLRQKENLIQSGGAWRMLNATTGVNSTNDVCLVAYH